MVPTSYPINGPMPRFSIGNLQSSSPGSPFKDTYQVSLRYLQICRPFGNALADAASYQLPILLSNLLMRGGFRVATRPRRSELDLLVATK